MGTFEPRPTAPELTDAVEATVRGRSGSDDALAALLLTISRDEGSGLLAHAEQQLADAEPSLWLTLDRATRRMWWQTPGWSEDVAHRLRAGRARPLELALAACHPSGYVREAAVATIAESAHPATVPVLALRAGDWVEQVRDRARPACRVRLDLGDWDGFASLAPVGFALRERADGGWLAAALEEQLRHGPLQVLAAGLTSHDRRTRRTSYTVALAEGRLALAPLVRAALRDDDIVIRLRCADEALRRARAAADTDVPRTLLGSRTAGVRAEAINSLAAMGSTEPARVALTDRAPLVRATARLVLRRAGEDPAERYRELAAGSAPEPVVIAGLGEAGDASDIATLRPWLRHPEGRIRAATIRALRGLGDIPVGELVGLLSDPAPGVPGQAAESLRHHASGLDERHLWNLLEQSPLPVRRAGVRLLGLRGGWTRLAVALRLLQDPEPGMQAYGLAVVEGWLEREAATTYAVPGRQRIDELATLIADAEPRIGARRAHRLRFHLGIAGRG